MPMGHRDAHLNLIDSSRQLFELDPGVEIEAGEGWLFGAGGSAHPQNANAGFPAAGDPQPRQLIRRARDFFGGRNRGFALWARGGAPEDDDLIATAEEAGLKQVYAMPEMILERRAEERPLPDGAELGKGG